MSEGWGSLAGIKVLDLTQVLAGPFATMLLADHGADVIKIEAPAGDLSRSIGPFHDDDTEQVYGGYFQSINRNKRSMVLDFKSPPDQEIFKQMVVQADVVVENFRVGVMERLGLSYEVLSALNPKLVYAAVTGFGDPRTGESPYARWPAFDVIAQAMGGFMSITGPADQPMKSGPGIGDILPGVFAAFGILAAVRHAEATGEGQFVDVAMYDAVLALCERIVHQHAYTGAIPVPQGNSHPLAAPFSIFTAQDGWVAIACPFDAQWQELCRIIGRPELGDDPRFASIGDRASHHMEITELLNAWCSTQSKEDLAAKLGGRVPFGPVNNVADIFADPHVRARGMLAEVPIEGLAKPATMAGTPIHFEKTPGGVHRRAPKLGEHQDEIMREFGIPIS